MQERPFPPFPIEEKKCVDLKQCKCDKDSVVSKYYISKKVGFFFHGTQYTNSSKKVWKLEFHRSYFSYFHTSNIVFDIIRNPVYLSLN